MPSATANVNDPPLIVQETRQYSSVIAPARIKFSDVTPEVVVNTILLVGLVKPELSSD